MTAGFGRMLRKEDQRFVRGQGTYTDDVHLPGMLYGAVLRSPHPHARIVSIDTVAAEGHPKVKAVITGEALKERNLAWMPTLAGDRQAVLATDKVRFQGQEVAFVVAEDHYAARDALELIDVEYEPLPAVADARRALDDAPPSSVTTSRTATTSSTGSPATPNVPTRSSATPRSRSARTCSTRGCTRRRWRPAASWPTSTRSAAS